MVGYIIDHLHISVFDYRIIELHVSQELFPFTRQNVSYNATLNENYIYFSPYSVLNFNVITICESFCSTGYHFPPCKGNN